MPAGSLLRRHALSAFFAGSVGLGSLISAGALLLPKGAALQPLLAVPISYVPGALAIVINRSSRRAEDRAAFRRSLTMFQVGWRWYAVAAVALPAVHAGGVALATLRGGKFPVQRSGLALSPLFLIASIGEEIGWRGYALPKLQERVNPLAAAVIVGLGWAAFHWVALLANSESPLAYVAVSTVLFTGMSVIIAYVFNDARQSVPIAILMHTAYNTVSVGVMPLAETGVPLTAFALSAAATWAVAIAIAVARRGSKAPLLEAASAV